MKTYHQSEIGAQVAKIRAEIAQHGESVVGCTELSWLCLSTSESQEKLGLEQIAEWEGWRFMHLADGRVRFIPISVDISKKPTGPQSTVDVLTAVFVRSSQGHGSVSDGS